MPNQPISGNDLARFSGLQTFMRLPEASSLEGLDVCFLGIPMDRSRPWHHFWSCHLGDWIDLLTSNLEILGFR